MLLADAFLTLGCSSGNRITPSSRSGQVRILRLSDKSILITGGTGSFGKAFVQWVLTRFPDVRRLVIYSRDEFKQFDMSQTSGPRHREPG